MAILVLRRDWFKQSNRRWLLGCYVAALGLWQVCEGVLEGAFHETYVSGAAAIFSPACCAGYSSALLGVALYCMAIPRPAVAGIPQAG